MNQQLKSMAGCAQGREKCCPLPRTHFGHASCLIFFRCVLGGQMVCIIHLGAQKFFSKFLYNFVDLDLLLRFLSRINRANIPRVWWFDVSCHEGQMLSIFQTILEKDSAFPMLSIFQTILEKDIIFPSLCANRTCCPLRVIKFHPNNESFFRPIDLPVWSRDHVMNLSPGPSGRCWINAEEGHEGCSLFLFFFGECKSTTFSFLDFWGTNNFPRALPSTCLQDMHYFFQCKCANDLEVLFWCLKGTSVDACQGFVLGKFTHGKRNKMQNSTTNKLNPFGRDTWRSCQSLRH